MNYQAVKGMRDFLPEDMMVRKKVFNTAEKVLEDYGFQPLSTPALEYLETLTAKSGEDVKEELYYFRDKGGRRVGLRFDLTVPAARVLAENKDLIMPFKRYQYGKVWRYGEVKKGRLREFYQFDFDVYGSDSLQADAEIIRVASRIYEELGLDVVIRVNNRKLLAGMMAYAGVKKGLRQEAFRALDKLDKVGLKGVEEELRGRGISNESVKKIKKLIKIKGDDWGRIGDVVKNEEGLQGIKELKELESWLEALGVTDYVIDLSLARGLDYYTGPVFEASCKGINVSVGGGGRYDGLIGLLSGRDLPATGFSLGVEPIFELLREKEGLGGSADLFLASVSTEFSEEVLGLAEKFRSAGSRVETDLMERNLSKQLDYASRMNIPFVIVVGEKELEKEEYGLKNMKTGKTEFMKVNEVIKALKDKIH